MRRASSVIFAVLFSLLIFIQPAFSQFAYDKIEDDAGFEFYKPVEFHTNPRYNRVEGFFPHAGVTFRPVELEGFAAHVDAGWGFWNESGQQFRFNAGVQKDFMDFDRLSIGVDVFRALETADNWVVDDIENSLASFLFREDYQDYYGVHGLRIFADKKVAGNHTLRLELNRRTYTALNRNINWSVFKGNFQENPTLASATIAEGDEFGIKLIAALDWRDNPIFPLSGWYVEGIYEHTADDFDTDGLFLSVKRYQQTFANQRLLLRGMIGTRTGSVAEQHSIDLGGVGSLRAFNDKEFSGNRMVMLNANYLFAGDILQKIPLQRIPLFGSLWTTLSLGLFMDTGWADFTSVDDGLFSGFSDVNFKTDFGLSVLFLEGVFRIDVARRTSLAPGTDRYRITFRLLDTL